MAKERIFYYKYSILVKSVYLAYKNILVMDALFNFET